VYGLEPKSATYDLSFEGVPDAEMQDDVFRARSEKERKSLQELLQTAATITTISDFHRWFFTTHEAYNAERGAFGGGRVAGAALESY
jgi:hypothetical protein